MRRRASRMLRSSSTARTRGRSAGHDIVPASVSIIRPVSPTPWLRRVVEGATWLPRPGSRAKAGILRPSARDIRGNPDTDGAGIVTVPDTASQARSEEHTSELQSRLHLVCRLLLEKKKNSAYVGALLQQTTL